MVTICTRIQNEPRVRAIAESNPGIWYTFGVHPMSVADHPPSRSRTWNASPAIRAWWGSARRDSIIITPPRVRRPSRTASASISRPPARTGLPLIIHARAADEDMARILTEEWRAGAYDCVMHCFSSGPDLARAALDLGFYLSVSGIAAFPRSQDLRDILAAAPVDRILVETDSPYLAPPPHRGGGMNRLCRIDDGGGGGPALEHDAGPVAVQTCANFDRLFAKAAAFRTAA